MHMRSLIKATQVVASGLCGFSTFGTMQFFLCITITIPSQCLTQLLNETCSSSLRFTSPEIPEAQLAQGRIFPAHKYILSSRILKEILLALLMASHNEGQVHVACWHSADIKYWQLLIGFNILPCHESFRNVSFNQCVMKWKNLANRAYSMCAILLHFCCVVYDDGATESYVKRVVINNAKKL